MADSQETINAVMQKDITSIKESLLEINGKLDNKYVTKEEFGIVQKIVFGEVALILFAVLSAIVYLVVIHPHV